MLMKLTENGKKLLDLTVFFALLGSAGVKAARRTLVKLTPGRDPSSLSANKIFSTADGIAVAAVGHLTASTSSLAKEALTQRALTLTQDFKVLASNNISI